MSDETNKNQALGTDAPRVSVLLLVVVSYRRIGTVGLMITAAPITRAAPPATPESTSRRRRRVRHRQVCRSRYESMEPNIISNSIRVQPCSIVSGKTLG